MISPDVIFWEVDTQADFMLSGGNLYVPGVEKIIPNVKRLVEAARRGRVFLVSDADQHTPDDPEFRQFPPHCVRGTPGAEIIPEGCAERVLVIPNDAKFALPANLEKYQQVVLEKQTLDVFDNPQTEILLQRLGREPEFAIFGVVTEYCVRCAALGLRNRGRRVAVVTDAIEALDPQAGRRTLKEFSSRGIRLISTNQALASLETISADSSAVGGNR